MGLFRKLISLEPDYKVLSTEAKTIALNFQLTATEHEVVKILGAELPVFVAERHFLFAGLSHAFLTWSGDGKHNHVVSLARQHFDELMERHFTHLPGVDANVGRALLRQANQKYHLGVIESFAATFIEAVTGGRLGKVELVDYPELEGLVDGYKQVCCKGLARKVIELTAKQNR